jgi:hypothetical protein
METLFIATFIAIYSDIHSGGIYSDGADTLSSFQWQQPLLAPFLSIASSIPTIPPQASSFPTSPFH